MIQAIDSLELPELLPYLTLRRPLEHHAQRIIVAEGEKLVHRLLASRWEVVSLLLTPECVERLFGNGAPRGERTYDPAAYNIYVGPRALLSEIVGYRLHQGAMAVARLPAERSLEAVMASARWPRLLVALDSIAHAENAGVLVRNAAAFGAGALLVGERSASPYLRRAVRNSMGTIFELPVIHCGATNGSAPGHNLLIEALTELRARHGIRLVATEPTAAHPLHAVDLSGDICLVFGNEENGVTPAIAALCDERAAIPMPAGVDSLNVGSASAVFLYEVARQRAAGGGSDS